VPTAVLSPGDLRGFVLALAGAPRQWRRALDAQPPGVRQYAEVWSDEFVNAWAIRWADDADTGFHDHDGSAAAIVVLEGEVVEERLALAGPPIARRFAAGQHFDLPPSAIHRVRHGGGIAALTVHAYSPPLRIQGVYGVDDAGALRRETVSYTEELRAELAAVAA
jgi:hypothetical protein